MTQDAFKPQVLLLNMMLNAHILLLKVPIGIHWLGLSSGPGSSESLTRLKCSGAGGTQLSGVQLCQREPFFYESIGEMTKNQLGFCGANLLGKRLGGEINPC